MLFSAVCEFFSAYMHIIKHTPKLILQRNHQGLYMSRFSETWTQTLGYTYNDEKYLDFEVYQAYIADTYENED